MEVQVTPGQGEASSTLYRLLDPVFYDVHEGECNADH